MDQCLSEPERSNDPEEVLEEVDLVEVSTRTQRMDRYFKANK